MIPILFSPDASDFTTNGVGRLTFCATCRVHTTFDGEDELTLTYPMAGAHYGGLVQGAVVLVKPSAKRNPQPYRIYKISRPIGGMVEVHARHISYQLSTIVSGVFSAANLGAALEGLVSHSATNCPFTLAADFESEAPFSVSAPASIRSLMGGSAASVQNIYGGIWEFDGYTCTLRESRGEETGIRIAYGKNLRDLTQEEDIGEFYTSVYPYWISGSTLVELPEKIVHCENVEEFPFPRVTTLDCSTRFEGQPTAEQLRTYAQAFISENALGIPRVSLQLSFYSLSEIEEYRGLFNEYLDVCDIVRVSYPALGVDREAQVSEITWDALRERYDDIVVGDRRSTLAGTIEDQIETISTMPTRADVNHQVDHATGILSAGRGGHVVLNRNADGWVDEVLIMDNADYSLAQKVLRINQNGIGFSSSGYSGPYFQAWTLDGILSLGGVNNAYGVLQLRDAQGNVIGTFSAAEGLRFANGQAIGFEASGQHIAIGDFEVTDKYGRQTLQSTDEYTGISGNPNNANGYFAWFGWHLDSNTNEELFGLVVDSEGAKVQWYDENDNLVTYNIGEDIYRIKKKIEDIEDALSNL